MVWEGGVAIALGVGFTSTAAVIDGPEHPFATGIIVNVTVTGEAVVFVNEPLISPEPLGAMPVTAPVLSLVQLNEVPLTLLVSAIELIVAPEQIVCDDGVATAFGVGFTNTVAIIGAPEQLPANGVIVNVTVAGAVVVLVSAPLISPEPLAAMPVTVPVLSLVQLYIVPAVALLSTIVVTDAPEQIVCDAGAAIATGTGFTNTVAVTGTPEQPLAPAVIVKVTVIGAAVAFVNIPLISPLPEDAMPVTDPVLSLVQL
jgi:hypothetical protein